MRRILCLSFSPLHSDPRVHRQLQLLAEEGEVTAAGYTDPAIHGVRFVAVPQRRKTTRERMAAVARLAGRQVERHYWSLPVVRAAHDALRGQKFDLIVANDSDTWPLALALRGAGRVLLDAHEYAPREFEDIWWWRLLHQPFRTALCRRSLPLADAVTTVCAGIAAEYATHFGVQPAVVMNAAPQRSAAPSPVARGRCRLIHHGVAIRSRRIEAMIHALDLLDERFQLDLMLVANDPAYLDALRALGRSRPRVRFLPPVPMREIPEATRDYDVGLFLLEPVNFNYRHALPNKFFEFIQARLAVAIGPSPEMARLVGQFDCGIVAEDFQPTSLARALRTLTPETIARFKANADRAAGVLCWEREREKLRAVVQRLLAGTPCAA